MVGEVFDRVSVGDFLFKCVSQWSLTLNPPPTLSGKEIFHQIVNNFYLATWQQVVY